MDKPFGWFGGKHYLLKNLLLLIPPHRIYVEVFGGSAALLFAKKPSKLEVYNDLDEGLVHFFRVLRSARKAGELKKLLELTPYARKEYDLCRSTYHSENDPVERARKWYVIARMSFAGNWGSSWGYSAGSNKNTVSSYLNKVRRLHSFSNRVRKVQIDCKDFRKIFNAYDDPDTLFFCDPPYVPDTRKGGTYQKEMTNEDHRDLVRILRKIQGKVILCGYPNRIYDVLTHSPGWHTRQFSKRCRAVNERLFIDKEKLRRTEMIWLNYNIEDSRCPS